MESWLQRLFLTLAVAVSVPTLAQDDEVDDNTTILDGVINPDVERRKIDESQIDSENFEMGFMAGVMSVEDFGSNNSVNVLMAYHISEDWFLEGTYGATRTSETSFEVLSGSTDLLTDDQRNLSYYNLSLGLNLLPGEVFIANHAFNTSYYVIAGVGNTRFADNDYFTLNYGAGFRIFPTDWVALRIGFRNHLFTHDILGVDKSIQNLEANMGLSLYF